MSATLFLFLPAMADEPSAPPTPTETAPPVTDAAAPQEAVPPSNAPQAGGDETQPPGKVTDTPETALIAEASAQAGLDGGASGGTGIGIAFNRRGWLITAKADVTSTLVVEGDEAQDYGSRVVRISPDLSNFSVNGWVWWAEGLWHGAKAARDARAARLGREKVIEDTPAGRLGLRLSGAVSAFSMRDSRDEITTTTGHPEGTMGVFALDVAPLSYRLALGGGDIEKADPESVFVAELGWTGRFIFDDEAGYGRAVLGFKESDFTENAAFRHGVYAMARFRRAEMEPFVRVVWMFGMEEGTSAAGLTGGSVILGMTVKGDILTVGSPGKMEEGLQAGGRHPATPPAGELNDIL